MLKTRCIKYAPNLTDGLRISVMSRHTLSDGITPDNTITKSNFDEWWPELAPNSSLLGDYYKRGLPWAEFERQYRHSLEDAIKHIKVIELISVALRMDVSILCIETSPSHCHRRLLAEHCKKIEPGIEVILQ